MKATSEKFKLKAESSTGARYYVKIEVDGVALTDSIDNFTYSAMTNDDNSFVIGNTDSAIVNFTINEPSQKLGGLEVDIFQGINIDGNIEYVKLGVFKVLKPTEDRGVFKYQCVDRMTYLMEYPYFSNLSGAITDLAIVNEVCEQVSISFVQNGFISHSIASVPSGYTRREIIAYMAQLQGKNAIINEDGNLEFVWYTETDYMVDDNKIYYDGTADINSEIDYELGYIECTVRNDGNEEVVLKVGSGTTGMKILNPFMTQDILNEIFERIGKFSFRPTEFEFLGDFRLEVGDIVTVETNGTSYRVPIMQIEHSSDGGVITTIRSVAETESESEIDLRSPQIKEMDRYYAQLVLINQAVVNKLSAEEADIRYATIENLTALNTVVNGKLSAEEADLKYANIKDFNALSGTVGDLKANSLTADSAVIKSLQGGVADINTLIFGSATGTTIQTEFANAVIAQLGDAQIKSAMIKDIAASKITSGDIITNNVRVMSEDGSLVISDETIQISDGTRVRVQIGKDASDDYSLSIWDASGKLMFSKGGITENAIKDAIIRDDMVSDTANISAHKLNIDSLFEEINGSSNTIKATQIYLDDESQRLNVAFKTMTEDVDGLAETQQSQGTAISTIQGQISSKIWQQDITTAIDDIEVGAVNLLDGSKDLSDSNSFFAEFNLTDGTNQLTFDGYALCM